MIAFDVLMVEGLVCIEQDDLGGVVLSGNEPFLSQVDKPATIDKHEQFYALVFFRVFDFLLQFCVSRYGVNFILNAFTF